MGEKKGLCFTRFVILTFRGPLASQEFESASESHDTMPLGRGGVAITLKPVLSLQQKIVRTAAWKLVDITTHTAPRTCMKLELLALLALFLPQMLIQRTAEGRGTK